MSDEKQTESGGESNKGEQPQIFAMDKETLTELLKQTKGKGLEDSIEPGTGKDYFLKNIGEFVGKHPRYVGMSTVILATGVSLLIAAGAYRMFVKTKLFEEEADALRAKNSITQNLSDSKYTDRDGKTYVRFNQDAPLDEQLSSYLTGPDGRLIEFENGVIGDENISTILLDYTNRNFALMGGTYLDDGEYALIIKQVSDGNPLPWFYGNPGRHRWTATTLSDALTGITNFFNYTEDENELELIKQKTAAILNRTFGYEFDPARINLVDNGSTFTNVTYAAGADGRHTDMNGRPIPASMIDPSNGRFLVQMNTELVIPYSDIAGQPQVMDGGR